MNKSDIDEDLKNFRSVDFFRGVKNRMSAELNAMTPEERRLYSEQLNVQALDFFAQTGCHKVY